MRGAVISLGLAIIVLDQSVYQISVVEEDRAIPRFVLHHDKWVCLDRNPRQLNREDCRPPGANKDK